MKEQEALKELDDKIEESKPEAAEDQRIKVGDILAIKGRVFHIRKITKKDMILRQVQVGKARPKA